MEFKEKLAAFIARIESAIDQLTPSSEVRPTRIHEAMRYSLSAGGKRIRPALVLASSELFSSNTDALPAAVAVECLHTYTLIHDDLPGMDDSKLRRGVDTCHIRFDEATAILAGDALLTLAFELLAKNYASEPRLAVDLIATLSETAGSQKLIGGQMEDILGESRPLDEDELEYIHLNKTSALIEASLNMGAAIGGANEVQLDSISQYGRCIGLGFQIMDDILDVTSDSRTMGKTVGADAAANKTTYVSVHGLEESKSRLASLTSQACEICDRLDAPFLKQLASYLNERTH
jgi:geranylgeranyl diphosphate synthase type II